MTMVAESDDPKIDDLVEHSPRSSTFMICGRSPTILTRSLVSPIPLALRCIATRRRMSQPRIGKP